MKTGSIYIIRNTINNKVYIGQTTMSVRDRFMAHQKPCTIKQRGTYKIYNAMAKYGAEKFYVETLEEDIPIEELDKKEIAYIAKYNSYNCGYNTTQGGDGRMIAKIEDEEKLINLFKNGLGAEEIAKEFNCNKATIFRTLHKLGFYYRKKPDEKTLKELVKQGYTYNEISNIMRIPDWTIERYAAKYGITKYKKRCCNRENFDYGGLKKDYYEGIDIKDICKKYDITKTTFYRIKKKMAMENRK